MGDIREQARSEEEARESTKREGANGSWSLHDKRI